MNKKKFLIIIVLLVALPTVFLVFERYKVRRNTERNLFERTQNNMKRILALSKEYNEKDPYTLYLKLFGRYRNHQYVPYLFMDFRCVILDKKEGWYHYYAAMRLFGASEEKGQPLSRDDFEKANDFLILSDAQNNVFIYSKISNIFYPDINNKTETK